MATSRVAGYGDGDSLDVARRSSRAKRLGLTVRLRLFSWGRAREDHAKSEHERRRIEAEQRATAARLAYLEALIAVRSRRER